MIMNYTVLTSFKNYTKGVDEINYICEKTQFFRY